MNVMRQRKLAAALCSDDAKSCYDRIAHDIAALSLRRQGAPSTAVRSMSLTLQQANHRIRTAFELSHSEYGKSRYPPLQGVGQGNGAALTTWACISTPLVNMMRTAGFGVLWLSAITGAVSRFVCCAFVDDTDVVHSARQPNTP